MPFFRLIAAGAAVLSAACAGCGAARPSQVYVVVNAKVWTGDPARPSAEAFVVREGRFAYVGDTATARQHGGELAPVIDAGGARIVPGIIDAHLHLLGGGLQLSRLNLRNVPDREAFIAKIAERARQTSPGRWILGGRWSTESWPNPSQPTRVWIDAVTPQHPVLLSRMDGHGALANGVALRLAGIDRHGPPDPAGGRIERDAKTREPTGILRDAAIDLVRRRIPTPSDEAKDAALLAAMREANRHGITCVHTMSNWAALLTFDRARAAGRLTLRIRQYVSEDDWPDYLERVRQHANDDWLRVVGFKQFADGSLGSRTAYMARPFADNPADRPDWCGLPGAVLSDAGYLEGMCVRCDAAGLSPAIHAIGDRANHEILDIYEAVAKRNGPSQTRRLRIEHAQHLLPADIQRFAKLGVVASMQPLHKADDGRYAERALGPARCKTSYAFRSLLDVGTHVAFGSDWPVVTLNPFLGIHAAVTGQTLDHKTFVPAQNISVTEALRAYTSGGAHAAGDSRLGRIATHHLADFVILDADVLTVSPPALKTIHPKATYVAGRRVWPPDGE